MVKGILMVFVPHPGRILVSELSHWFTFVGQMGNKLGQLVYKSKKVLHSFDFFCPRASSWAWHFLDCTDHLRVRLYSTWCQQVANVGDLRQSELSFFGFNFKLTSLALSSCAIKLRPWSCTASSWVSPCPAMSMSSAML